MNTLKQKIVSGAIWRFADIFMGQAVSFLVGLVLARLLEPNEFGTVALLTIFIKLSECFVSGGFGTALIQKKTTDELDYNSVFFFTLGISILFYLILWFSAPAIARFYDTPILVLVLRVMSLRLILDGINGVQNAVLSRNMLFHLGFRISTPSIIVTGIVGIWMAYTGYGLWALVWSSLAGSLVGTILRWLLIGWRPSLHYSWTRIRSLFRFGSGILGTSLMITASDQLYGLVIGKWYTPNDLAFFNRGDNIPTMLRNLIQASINGVSLPVLSQMQDDNARFRLAMKRFLQLGTFLIAPVMVGLMVTGPNVIRILFSDKWIAATPFLQMMCLASIFWPMDVLNRQMIVAKGDSRLHFSLQLINKGILLIALLASFQYGVFWIAFSRMILTPICAMINALPGKRMINYSIPSQFRDLAFILFPTTLMGVCMWCVGLIPLPPIILLSLQAIIGIALFVSISLMLKLEPAQDIIQIAKEKMRKKKTASL